MNSDNFNDSTSDAHLNDKSANPRKPNTPAAAQSVRLRRFLLYQSLKRFYCLKIALNLLLNSVLPHQRATIEDMRFAAILLLLCVSLASSNTFVAATSDLESKAKCSLKSTDEKPDPVRSFSFR